MRHVETVMSPSHLVYNQIPTVKSSAMHLYHHIIIETETSAHTLCAGNMNEFLLQIMRQKLMWMMLLIKVETHFLV